MGHMTTNVIRYHRFSTPNQERGDSLERQARITSELCLQNGWTIIETVEDLGRSAYKGHHLSKGHLGELTRRIELGLIPKGTILVAEKFDRLARLPRRDTQAWINKVTSAGMKIALADPRKVYDDRTSLVDDIEILLRAELAWQESEQKSERVLSARRSAWQRAVKKEGAWVMNGRHPEWMTKKTDRTGFDIIEPRAEIVRQIYQLSADGVGAPSIARILNDQGEKPWGKWRKNAPAWDRGTVRTILAHPAVEGRYVAGAVADMGNRSEVKIEGEITDYFDRIVDADLVARGRAGVMSREKIGKRGKALGIANIFAGAFRCAVCSGPCYMGWGARNPSKSLRCKTHGCTNRSGFKYRPFEQAALDQVLALALDSRFFEASDELARLRIMRAELVLKIDAAKARKANQMRLNEDLGGDPDVANRIREINGDVKVLEDELSDVDRNLTKASGVVDNVRHLRRVNDIREAMESEVAETRQQARGRIQAALRGIVSSIELDPADTYRDPSGERTLTLILSTGVRAFKFSNDGEFLGKVDGDQDVARAEAGESIEPLLKRMA